MLLAGCTTEPSTDSDDQGEEIVDSSDFENDNNSEPEQLAKVETVKTDEPKLKRNEMVKITNGKDTQELKYKKAKPLIETGVWRII